MPAVFATIVFLADRLLKILTPSIVPEEGVFLLPKIFAIKFFRNYGAAFGIKSDPFLIAILSLSALALIFFLIKKQKGGKIPKFVFLALFLGATSNILDRIYYGYVADYFSFFNYSFFNLADLMILASLCAIIYYNLREK